MIELCPCCSEGVLHRQVEETLIVHLDKVGMMLLQIDVCDSCGAKIAGQEASRENKAQVTAFRAKVEKLKV